MLAELFHYYMQHPKEIGATSRKRARKPLATGPFAINISGMNTTGYLQILEHQRLFGLKQWSGGVLGLKSKKTATAVNGMP